jgi:aminopeptidase N
MKTIPSTAAIWSQGETEFNHYWFPCYDHPNDFTTTELFAIVEKPHGDLEWQTA